MNRFIQTLRAELHDLDTSAKKLRTFGFLFAAIFLVVYGYLRYVEVALAPALLPVAIAFLLVSIVAPRFLLWLYYVWMSLAIVLGFFVGELILTVLYFLVVSPLAMIRRAFRRATSKAKTDSNWVPVSGLDPVQKMDRLF